MPKRDTKIVLTPNPEIIGTAMRQGRSHRSTCCLDVS